jgi:nucleotide-binding universal stress UspA family protein
MKAVQAKTRISLQKILFATDFSAASEAAVIVAKQIAQRYGAKICGVHVNGFSDYTAVAPDAWPAMKEAEEREAREDSERLNQELQGVEHEVVVGQGRVWEVLSRLIEEKEIDLVIVGTKGRTGLEKMLVGSVAEEILRQARCPVLTVGPHVKVWSDEYAQMREILCATDLTADLPVATPYAISLAQENQAHLVLLHVIEDPKPGDLVKQPQVVDFKKRKLQELVPQQAGLKCEPTYIIEEGRSAEKILDVAKRRHTDVIVLGARPAKSSIGAATHLGTGTAHQVILQAPCPVLTVRS